MSVSSDEVNYLIFRYLQENGFLHSSFTFAYESMVAKSSISHSNVPPGALITILQKGLEYIAIEEHIGDDGTVKEFDNNFSLLSPFICDAMAHREDRRIRRPPSSQISSTSPMGGATSNNFSSSGGGSASNAPNAIQNAAGGSNQDGIPPPGTVTLRYDSETNDRWLILGGHQSEVFMCHWSPCARQLASGSADGTCRLWSLGDIDSARWLGNDHTSLDLETSILPHTSNIGERLKDITSITWSPDGQFLATGCYDGMARIWDNNGRLKMELKEHSGPVFSLKWNKQGNYILSGSYDRKIVVWNTKTGTVFKSFMMHSAPVLDVDWKDSEIFATCSSDKSIFVWKVSSKDPIMKFEGHEDEVNSVCWSPGGHYLASCSDDSTAKVWSIEKGLIHNLVGHSKEIYTVKWTPTGPGSANPKKELLLCTASFDGTVKVWGATDGSIRFNLQKQGQPVYSISPSPSGEFIATGSFGGHVSVWSLANGSLSREILGVGDTFDVSWSHDGALLGSCFSTGVLNIIDVSGPSFHPQEKVDLHSNNSIASSCDNNGSGQSENNPRKNSMKDESTNSINSSGSTSTTADMNSDTADSGNNGGVADKSVGDKDKDRMDEGNGGHSSSSNSIDSSAALSGVGDSNPIADSMQLDEK